MTSEIGVTKFPKSPAGKDVRENIAKTFYSLRAGNAEHAFEDIKRYIDEAVDGIIISYWVLSEIDHWDHEKERVCVVTEKQLLIIKYNFVALRIEECRRINLKRIDKIQSGNFVFPKYSMMTSREHRTGFRLHVNKNYVMSRWERWNPFNKNTPYFTFTQHKAVPLLDEIPRHLLYDDFKKSLTSAIEGVGATFEAVTEDIPLDVYVGVMATVYNSSDIGYSKDRGAVSF